MATNQIEKGSPMVIEIEDGGRIFGRLEEYHQDDTGLHLTINTAATVIVR